MKINIWVHKRDIESGKITDFYNICPQQSMWKDWFQIEVDQDTFVELQDQAREKRMNIIGQNGNDGMHYDNVFGNDKGDEDKDEGLEHDQNDQPFAD
jgi:hypothetical protein|tara:strand:- start:140 stop:430 length:291 start_codon:yes stop_codon:yes gene_type:complete